MHTKQKRKHFSDLSPSHTLQVYSSLALLVILKLSFSFCHLLYPLCVVWLYYTSSWLDNIIIHDPFMFPL